MKKTLSLIACLFIFTACSNVNNEELPNVSDTCTSGEGCLSSDNLEFGYDIGDIMPNVELTTLDGQTVNLYDLMEGKTKTIVSLEASWCSDCERQNNKYQSVYESLPEDVLFIPIFTSYSKEDHTADLETSKQVMIDEGYTFEAYYDEGDYLWKKFDAVGTPTNIVLDENARIKAITLEYDFDILLQENKDTITAEDVN